jgi:transposase InsO family protein
MGWKVDWNKIGEIVQKIKEHNLSYKEGAQQFGIKVRTIYEYSFIVVTRKKIWEVLKAHGLEKTCDSSFDRDEASRKGPRRFEAAYPRDLYQMDITYVYLTGLPVLYLVVIIDDYSRFCVGAELRSDQRAATMIEVLHLAITRYGKPRRLLNDQGRSFYTWSHENTLFQKYLDDMDIDHLVTGPHSPETIGKVERLNQTIQREVLQKFSSPTILRHSEG